MTRTKEMMSLTGKHYGTDNYYAVVMHGNVTDNCIIIVIVYTAHS